MAAEAPSPFYLIQGDIGSTPLTARTNLLEHFKLNELASSVLKKKIPPLLSSSSYVTGIPLHPAEVDIPNSGLMKIMQSPPEEPTASFDPIPREQLAMALTLSDGGVPRV